MSNFQIFGLVFLAGLSLPCIIWRLKQKSGDNRFHPVLAYHKVTDEFEWGITRVKPESFEQQMEYLKEKGFSSIDLEELLSGEEKKDKQIVFTFDDGYESVYQNAFPVLKRYGFKAIIFIITGYTGKENSWEAGFGRKFRHLSWEQIQEMKESGFQFGSHTVNHPDLTGLNRKSLEYELRKSKEIIEDKLNQEVKSLSYPFSRHNQLVRTEAKNAGYKAAFTLTSEISENPFAIGRKGVYLFDTPLSIKIKLSRSTESKFGKGLFWIEEYKSWIINQFATGTILVKRYKSSGGL
ncbi:MAG: polysaccharide deacetylase family protein [candidate division Zixibacteria bacterium]|nr:polysaccharide deacetylase family protein [candidate division Zixibacteria bacterium]